MSRSLFFIGALFLTTPGYSQHYVGLLNGKKMDHESVVLKSPMMASNYLLADDSIQYPLTEVKYYQSEQGYFLRRNTSNEFMYRKMDGALELFSVIRGNNAYNPTTGTFNSSR